MSIKSKENKFWPLVPCAGVGARSGAQKPKQYVDVAGKAVVAHTLTALQDVPVLEKVTVVLSSDDHLFATYCPDFQGYTAFVGGETRANSVRAGLQVLRGFGAKDDDWVLVHDAARCLLLPQWIEALIATCQNDEVGGLLAQPVPDTLKRAVEGRSCETVSRKNMWLAQTPQMFRLRLLEDALDQCATLGVEVTDEASSIETLGLKPKLVAASADNFKLTYPEDFERVEMILAGRMAKIGQIQP